ncbi:MAG: ribonuclease HII [Eubacterium sp.]|nr:ribonuclease HII [Eubacterium sp.]
MSQGIKEIEEIFKLTPLDEIEARAREYESDERGGVKKIIEKYRKKIEARQAEGERLDSLFYFEKKYRAECPVICGIDEVGRGPFAGPVVAGAVILPADVVEEWSEGTMRASFAEWDLKNGKTTADSIESRNEAEGASAWMDITGLNDSKKVSEKRREALYHEITSKAVAYGIGVIPPARIDEINILEATKEAMKLAIEDLGIVPDMLMIDAVKLPTIPIRQVSIVKGDARSLSIAAASIVAKETRDRMMVEYAELYPEYHFEKNVGYGTAEHIAALKEHGPCAIHRRSFIGNYV